jgi:catechol 2,3-dioxygenase-like lactoylglutathione lyase family enzyme
MQPLAVHHVSVNVTDAERSIAFYTDVLGGIRRDDRPDFGFGGAWIDLGASVHLIQASVPPNFGQHFAILVADLTRCVSCACGLEVGDRRGRVGSADLSRPTATSSSSTRSATTPLAAPMGRRRRSPNHRCGDDRTGGRGTVAGRFRGDAARISPP